MYDWRRPIQNNNSNDFRLSFWRWNWRRRKWMLNKYSMCRLNWRTTSQVDWCHKWSYKFIAHRKWAKSFKWKRKNVQRHKIQCIKMMRFGYSCFRVGHTVCVLAADQQLINGLFVDSMCVNLSNVVKNWRRFVFVQLIMHTTDNRHASYSFCSLKSSPC